MIINNISKLRKEKNITQEQLANELEVSRQTLISIENFKTEVSLDFAFKASLYFNKTIEEVFFERDDNMFNKKISSIEDIKTKYGKNTIIIKDNLVFRCSTEVLEIGPASLLSYELPKYGQMKKFVVINNKVYELVATRDYDNRNDSVMHKVGKQVDIDYTIIDFDEKTAWNYKNSK